MTLDEDTTTHPLAQAVWVLAIFSAGTVALGIYFAMAVVLL